MKLLRIAKKYFDVDTLEYQGSDSLDFHDTSVGAMSAALKEAYELGARDMRTVYISQRRCGNPLPEVE